MMNIEHRFPYEWTLKDAIFTKDKGKVFSCFACGGGSTMGYKLAGFDVIGCNEIDPKMAVCYKVNHDPQYCFIEPIQTFKERDDLPAALYDLDILDGSPPCSSFSMAGNREKDWGKDKKFREGQAKQVLDTLFFDFIDLAKKLKPKVIVAENVKGLLLGAAQRYVDKVLTVFDEAGYYVDFTLLNASKMGVPQRRERVFFCAIRKDMYSGPFTDLFGTRPDLDLAFTEPEIPYKAFRQQCSIQTINGEKMLHYWRLVTPGQSFSEVHETGSYFNEIKLHPDQPFPTIRVSGLPYDYEYPREPTIMEVCCAGSYPQDYDFRTTKHGYLIGMSVPPVMIAQIATRIHEQWLEPMTEEPK